MKMTTQPVRIRLFRGAVIALAAIALCTGVLRAAPAPTKQLTFPTPDAAVQALLAALQQGDTATLTRILGPESQEIVSSGDPVQDRIHRRDFIQKAKEKCHLVTRGGKWAALKIGKDGWLFPVPLVKKGQGWHFDAVAGTKEVLARRVGHNELTTIDFCHIYVDAQREYFARHVGGLSQYARRIRSSKGKQDGLYWPVGKGEKESPLGPLAARAAHDGYGAASDKPRPFYGYYFRILEKQGPHAPGGEKSYLADGRMTRGFAMIAWPARYKNTGVMTFLVCQSGIVFQKDLGAETGKIAQAVTAYDPDDTWTPARKVEAPRPKK